MRVRRLSLLILFLFAFSSVCLASMTIYFKDGREVKVHKIVFKVDQADLYLMDGTLMNVRVTAIDLDLSGIGSPAGTYGETGVTGKTPGPLPRNVPMINSAARQTDLKNEWEKASVIAVAKQDVGSIRKGDTVHAYSPDSQSTSRSARTKKYYWYDDDRGSYWYSDEGATPITPDQAYILIYIKTDGTYGKKILDASTFTQNFEIQKSPSVSPLTPAPLPSQPPQPEEQVNSEPRATENAAPPESANQQPEENVAKTPAETLQQKSPATTEPLPTSQKKSDSLATLLGAIFGLIVGVALVVWLLRKRKRPFVDDSKFAQFERDLQDFELEIWLRHGRTMDQLMEICVKKFYQDNPSALNIAMKVMKGTQKNFVVPLIIKEAGVQSADAEQLYSEFSSRIESIRNMIEDVSRRKGLPPRSAATSEIPQVTQATIKTVTGIQQPAPPTPASMPKVNPNISTSASSAMEISIPVSSPGGNAGMLQPLKRGSSDLPPYASNLLDQLAYLSNSEEK